MSLLEQINKSRTPRHVAIIMDGNGRWAKNQGKERIFGHSHGVEAVRAALKAATKSGVEYLTLYAFSTENWNRPKAEVDALMELLIQTILAETATLNKNNIRLLAIGDLESLPGNCHQQLREAMAATASNTRMSLVLALSYSAKWELLAAVQRISQDVKNGTLDASAINEEVFSNYLTTVGIPDPELLIRTSGEHRISNFLLWQIAYSELYFTDKLWPEFTKEDFYTALIDYQQRERRFGLVSEQLK